MSQEFCRDVPDTWGCSKRQVRAHFSGPSYPPFKYLPALNNYFRIIFGSLTKKPGKIPWGCYSDKFIIKFCRIIFGAWLEPRLRSPEKWGGSYRKGAPTRINSSGIIFWALAWLSGKSGSEKGVFWKMCLFGKVHFLEILEKLEILEILENPETVENEGESDHSLEILENQEILENLEMLEILEIHPVKRPLS